MTATIDFVLGYEDHGYDSRPEREEAYRAGFVEGMRHVCETWAESETIVEDLDAAKSARSKARFDSIVRVPLGGDFESMYPPDHDIEAAKTRGYHQALAFASQAYEDANHGSDAIDATVLPVWRDAVEQWAKDKVERFDKPVEPPRPLEAYQAATGEDWKSPPKTARVEPTKPEISDPGPTPTELLRVPGFVGEVMDFCLETAPYPNQVMAFCGALSLQAFLAGRKVRDSGDNRSNLYLLGLAHSAAGKDWPRKLNTRIAHEAGLAHCLGDRFASGEGIQDALFATPSMLFQTDEIDGLLQSINRSKDARFEVLMGTLLTMFSASSNIFPMRPKAGQETPGVIDQPSLTIFGTAIPNHYYEALSERMLTNGLFARMIILESGKRGKGQEPSIRDLPSRVIEAAKWWAEFQPGKGNLKTHHPVPAVVEATDAAKRAIVATREQAEVEYAKAEDRGDPVGTTVWGRVGEQARKLSLIYAISENHKQPQIDAEAVEWASKLVVHQTQRMLARADGHVAESPFHAACLKVIQKLRDAPGGQLSHRVLLRRMKVKAREFSEMISTLSQRGDIEVISVPSKRQAGVAYRVSCCSPRGVAGGEQQ